MVIIPALKSFKVAHTAGVLLERNAVFNQAALQPRIVRLLQKPLKRLWFVAIGLLIHREIECTLVGPNDRWRLVSNSTLI